MDQRETDVLKITDNSLIPYLLVWRDNDVYYWENKYEYDFLTTKGEEIEGGKKVVYKPLWKWLLE